MTLVTVLHRDFGDSCCLRRSVTLAFCGLVFEPVSSFGNALVFGSQSTMITRLATTLVSENKSTDKIDDAMGIDLHMLYPGLARVVDACAGLDARLFLAVEQIGLLCPASPDQSPDYWR